MKINQYVKRRTNLGTSYYKVLGINQTADGRTYVVKNPANTGTGTLTLTADKLQEVNTDERRVLTNLFD